MRHIPALVILSLGLSASAAHADTITWTNWNVNSFQQTCPLPGYGCTTSGPVNSYNYYFPANAHGTMGSVGVTMNGLFDTVRSDYPSFGPTGTFNGGTVGNAPPQAFNSIELRGGLSAANNNVYYTDTITFSTPVTNPVMAIWSLGEENTDPADTAQFVFTSGEPFSIQSGGASTEYGGQFITQGGPGNETVFGDEGNGTIQFVGTYSQIVFTTPVYENYYNFTVGVPGSATPEPGSLVLLGTGLIGLAGAARRRLTR